MSLPAAGLALLLPFPGAVATDLPTSRVSDSIIQVGIVQRAASLTLKLRGPFSVVDQRTGETHPLKELQPYPVAAPGKDRIHFGPFLFAGLVRLLPKGPDGSVEVGDQRYRGSVLVRANSDSTVTLVNETGIEEYLDGVLPAEMSPEWPEEALKAQAVVARTFTLANLGKFQRSGFDLSDDQRSQVYVGIDRQDPRSTAAVRATEAEVLFWKGKLLRVFFHSCCGGHTSNIGAIWGSAEKAAKPVRGVSDRFCSASPHYEWKAYFSDDAILEALQRHGVWATRLKGVGLGKRDPSGYARTVRFYLDRGAKDVRANDFRNWIGNTDLKSTKIVRIRRRRRGYDFEGRGFGHGVGLCQWGAREQAARGRDYREILQHYFPGAEVRKRDDH